MQGQVGSDVERVDRLKVKRGMLEKVSRRQILKISKKNRHECRKARVLTC